MLLPVVAYLLSIVVTLVETDEDIVLNEPVPTKDPESKLESRPEFEAKLAVPVILPPDIVKGPMTDTLPETTKDPDIVG